jgi:pimeloyl-ACP methyl ester carboxylesterase
MPEGVLRMRMVYRVLIVTGMLIVVATIVGAVYQSAASARDAAGYPMPGQRIDIGGRSLHVYCSGSGTPTVLLENGLAANYTAWQLVQPSIAEFTRVCSYDRAGMGWSDSSPNATQPRFVNADLYQLLTRAEIASPYVLVGASAGGVFVRDYYHQHPSDIVGMVLVDSAHEQQLNRFPHDPQAQRAEGQMQKQIHLCGAFAWTGIVRGIGVLKDLAAKLPEGIRPASLALSERTGYCGGVEHEMLTFDPNISQSAPPASLGDLPLIVLTHGRAPEAQDFPVAMPEPYLRETERVWRELQNELARLSTRSSQRIVASSGHAISVEAPDTVVQAVRDVIGGDVTGH